MTKTACLLMLSTSMPAVLPQFCLAATKTKNSHARAGKDTERTRKLAILQKLMEKVNYQSKIDIDDLIAVYQKKTVSAIDQDPTLSEDEKTKQKNTYLKHISKKVTRLKGLLNERHIDLSHEYMNALVDECDRCWSKNDYKDIAEYSNLLNSHLFKSFRGSEFGEICERAGNRATVLMRPVLDQLQVEEKAGKFSSNSDDDTVLAELQKSAVVIDKRPARPPAVKMSPARAEKVAILNKLFALIHVPVDVDSVMEQGTKKTLDEIDKDQKLTAKEKAEQKKDYLRRTAKETIRLKQLLAERHMDFGQLFTGALIDELDTVWSMKDYRDLATLLRLEGSAAVKNFSDQWPEICNGAGRHVAASLAPVMNQLDDDERAGKFD